MKTKWLFTSIFFLVFCMSAYGVQVSAPDLEAQPGDAITVEISVDDATGIAGADFSLVYDPAILAATDARLTELGTGLIPSDPNLTVAGQVTMAIMGLQGIAEGSGAFIVVDFDVLPDASGVSPLDLSGIALYDELGGDLTVEVVNGSVTVLGVKGTGEVLIHHLEAFGAGDVDEIMADYTEDAVLISPDGLLRGPAEIRPAFEGMLADILPPGSPFLLAQQIIEGDIAYIVWSAESDNYDIPFGSDTFIIRDGSIITQTFAARMMPKVGDPAPPPAMLELPESPEKDVLMHHLDALGVGDVDAIMADYAEDAILITPEGVLRGPEEIRPLFESMLADILPPGSPFLMIQQIIEGEVVYIVWSAESESYNIHLGTDTFIIRDGKIVTQTFAAQMEAKPPVIDTEANKAVVVREFEEVWNQQDLDVIDEIYSPDNVFHDPAETGFMGREGYRQFVTIYITAFPDVQFTIEEQIAVGDKVATLWTATGTHQGELMGIPPTDVYAITTGINIAQVVDGQIVEEWAHWDALGQMQQLGVITPARPAPENYMWGAPSGVVGEAGDPEANKAVVMRSIEEVWNQGNLDVLDEIDSPDHVGHSPVELTSPMIGIEAAKAGIAVYLAAFPDVELTIEDIFAAGDKVVVRWSSTGTHEGELAGIPPTGKKTQSTGILMSRVVDGLITDSWWAWDALGLIQQITPPPISETDANKAFISEYLEALSGKEKPAEVVDQYVSDEDQALKQHIAMFEAGFPLYELIAEDMIAEGDKVTVRATFHGVHKGDFAGVPATDAEATVTLNITYRIAEGKIVEHWMEADQLGLMQQLGVVPDGRESYDWGAPSEVVGDPGDPEANKDLVLSIIEIWNQQDLDMVDELVSPDFVNHNPASGPPEVGIDAYKQSIVAYTTAFPDLLITVDDMVAEGDMVAKRWTATGTHQGELSGIPPLGTAVTFTGITIYRFADGKLVENWWAWDTLGLMQQITPTEPEPTPAEAILAMLAISDAAVNSQDPELLVSISVDDQVYDYVPMPPPLEGKEAIKEFFTGIFQTFPDLSVTLIRPPLVAEDIAVVEHTMTGTHLGELDLGPMGKVPPTGNSFQNVHMDIWEFEEGKVKKAATYDDTASQLMQLGILPAAEMPELVPSFTPPDAEPMGFSPLEAAAELDARWNDHDLSSYAKLIHPDANIMVAALGVPLDRDAYIALQEIYLMAFPDVHEGIVRVVDMGNGWVMFESIFTGTNSGPYFGIPATGLPITLRAGVVQRFDENGLMTDMAVYFDNLTILAQLGLLAPEEPPTKDYSNEFSMLLTSGLNMISLPLEPEVPYTARSFAEEIGATLVIRYDEVLKKFDGFALNAPGDGFIIEGGRGYIVNVLESKVVTFTGAAWANELPAEAAPPAAQSITAWAFLVNGTVLDSEDMSLSDSDYTVVVKNLRTGAVADETVGEGGYFAAVWADLNRKAVIEAGDKVEVAVVDSSGKVASGPFVHDVTLDGIRNALVKVQLRLGDIIPEKSALLQNYPNPFNPETWIPFHLKDETSVSVRIFNLSGQLVKTLDLGHRDAGVYVSRTKAAYWDGKNEAGEEVSSGIYFYSISAGDLSATRKMIIRK